MTAGGAGGDNQPALWRALHFVAINWPGSRVTVGV